MSQVKSRKNANQRFYRVPRVRLAWGPGQAGARGYRGMPGLGGRGLLGSRGRGALKMRLIHYRPVKLLTN